MPSRARVVVDNCLRLECGEHVPLELIERIMDELTLPNIERVKSERAGRWGWQELPEHLYLYETDGDTLLLPRGFAYDLKLWLREEGLGVKWIDRTTWETGEPYGADEFEYRFHQLPASDAMWKHRQGIYQAPTGSGKSGTVAGFLWRRHPQYALVLVDKINLLDQWDDDLRKLLGDDIDVATIGGGKWSEGRITIASLQTIWKRRQQLLEQGWFHKHSAVFLDECHHATAKTYRELIQLFYARIREGMSATPDKTGDFMVAINVLGPIFHEDSDEEMRDAGYTIAPLVNVVHTDFYFYYWGDHKVEAGEECDVPGCKRKDDHGHKNNYQKMKKALIEDHKRNRMIARYVRRWEGHHQLVVSTEVTQLENLRTALVQELIDEDEIFFLTGQHTRKQRREILRAFLAAARGVLLSTVAGEALNVPEIDCVHLPFPGKNPRSTEQQLGRGVRSTEGKEKSVIFDYADTQVPVLAKQFKSRRWKCYEPLGLDVNIIDN